MNKQTILKGRSNEHVLVGEFSSKLEKLNSAETVIKLSVEDVKLYHNKPSTDKYAEHGTLIIPKGDYEITNQVEFNPLTNSTSSIWD